jgi:pimeloyl-ACP methyl ester carboxylesterase
LLSPNPKSPNSSVPSLIKEQSAWQRQTLKFGHENADKYSSLVFDNRGMGASGKPLMRYSTSEMAKDIIELLDHLGWTHERELHVVGVSMGGMIAQELVRYHPPLHSPFEATTQRTDAMHTRPT